MPDLINERFAPAWPWINGNLQSNNSIYFEGDATVQRVWLTDLAPGSTHTLTLKYGTTMKAPSYLAINPMGKVPTLTCGDQIITETAAICAWLADRFPEKALAPPVGERAAYYRWLFYAAGASPGEKNP